MTARERLEHRRKPTRVQVFGPPPVVDPGRAARVQVLRTIRKPRHRKSADFLVFAPPVVLDTGRAGRFHVVSTRAARPKRHRARYTLLFHTGATPPAPVSGDLRRFLLGVGL